MKMRIREGTNWTEKTLLKGNPTKYFFVEKLEYGFYLRFCSENYIPCEKCQDELEKLILPVTTWIVDNTKITMHSIVRDKKLVLGFLISWATAKYFIPCDVCQERLEIIIMDAKEWHIGNDIKPPIELFRRWEKDDKRTQRLKNLYKHTYEWRVEKFLNNLNTTQRFDHAASCMPSYSE